MRRLKYRLLKEKIARHYMLGLTILCLTILFVIGLVLLSKAFPVFRDKDLFKVFFTSGWRPFKGEYGFLTFIFSTLNVTFIAILIALPFSLLTSIYLSEYSTSRIKKIFNPIIDLLSGIPPVIYGVWGTLTVVPLISEKIAPHFVDFSTGYSVLAGGIVLAIMITPLIISITNEVFAAIPKDIREASWSLGATKWETVKKVVLRKSLPGIIAAVVLAISRAFGETIAVLMVCGNVTELPASIFDSCYPLPALIANNYGEMMSLPEYEAALMFSALLLFIIIVIFNAGSRLILNRVSKRYQQ
ncbi:MAG TPA: phosphate ABC transporter permease subunit PstC [Tenuifilaceae bacterium]|nr:phosphate ABC transporter permease subunit PstC [Tenuifilaceae bacterium]HPI43661.1 phosphate ABC transporter permease subunit PstC [Tenuifilaceae bacterium]HPV55938.1 phosphate ABC transporter permease subunit PstC [Tenuifilaceae bacterium]